MGKTSIYLSDEMDAAWKASGVPLAELVRDGLAARQAALAGISGARIVILAALDEYAARHGSDTAGIPRTVTDTAEVPSPGTAPIPQSGTADVPHTAVAGEGRKGVRKGAPRPDPPRPGPARPPVSLPDLAAPLTVASALPKPARCPHPGTRITGGHCAECGPVKPGGLLRA